MQGQPTSAVGAVNPIRVHPSPPCTWTPPYPRGRGKHTHILHKLQLYPTLSRAVHILVHNCTGYGGYIDM
jgi:hypothetical protein